MNKLQEQRLKRLNSLLMEQKMNEEPRSVRSKTARRAARGESEQSSKSVEKSSLFNTATDLLTIKGGVSVLEKALGKAGVNAPAQITKSLNKL